MDSHRTDCMNKQQLLRTAHIAPWLASLVALMAAALISWPAQAATSANSQSPLGVNLQGVSYYSSEMPFLNIFKMGTGWFTQSAGTFDTGEEQYIDLDSDGYPLSLTAKNDPSPQKFTSVGALLMRSLPQTSNGYYPGGQYVVLYDGQGTLKYSFDAKLVSSAPGRDVINVTPSSNGIMIQITSTDPNHTGDYIRNIRVVQAQYESALASGQVFNPTFLADLKNFRALRFMDWLHTNNNTLSSWTDRPLPSNAFWGTNKGVPLEVCIELANAVSADAWLNIPVMATDDYITKMAKLAYTELNPAQKAYVEFSNEVWNGSFSQNAYSITKGQAAFPGQTNKYYAGWEWYGMRVAQVADIWYSVFGSTDFSSRVVVVMAGQTVNPYALQEELATPDWKGAGNGPAAAHHIGAAAVAAYFLGTPTSQQLAPMLSAISESIAMNDLYSQATAPNGDIAQTMGFIAKDVKIASDFNLPLVAYEGGQALNGGPTYAMGSPQFNLFTDFNRSSLMGSLYTTDLTDWKAVKGTMFMLYNDSSPPSQYGEWGLLESMMQTTTPPSSAPQKWQAVQNFIKNNPCWWAGCTSTLQSETPLTPGNFQAK